MQNPLPSVVMHKWNSTLRNVATMIKHERQIKATCTHCDYEADVDLHKVLKNRFPEYCMINRRFHCPRCKENRAGFYLYWAGGRWAPLKDNVA